MKYRKKPIEIDAVQWFPDKPNGVVIYPSYPGQQESNERQYGKIETLEGQMIVCPGDWIITGVKGEKYPCKPDIFEMTYDPIENNDDVGIIKPNCSACLNHETDGNCFLKLENINGKCDGFC